MPLAAAIIGGGTSIIGGLLGSSAAQDAAKAQAAAAQKAGQTVTNAAATVNPQIGAAATQAGQTVIGAGREAGTAVTGPGGAIQTANAGLNPYIDTGHQAANTLGTMLAPGGDLTKTFDASQMEANDPGYAMRIKQGTLALQRAQAATGGGGGGGAAKALVDYGQNAASAEYGNAFNRFQQSQQQKFGMLATTEQLGINPAIQAGQNTMQGTEYAGNQGVQTSEYAGTAGINAADLQAQNTMNAATYTGNAQMGAGNARAAGDMGAANAWSGALSGIGKAANTYGTLSTLGQPGGGGTGAPAGFTPYSSGTPWGSAPTAAPAIPAWNPGTYTMPSVFGNPSWNQ